MQLSCHLDALSNVENVNEYQMTFFTDAVICILGHLQDLKMVGWFDYKTCPGVDPSSQSSKKVNKFFSIWHQFQNSTTCQNNMMHT